MNEESANLSSAPKHVSFNHSVALIDDSGIEYVESLPPIINETWNESDSTMSFTELTETSDRYSNGAPQLAALDGQKFIQYSNFGEMSMSLDDFYITGDDNIVEQHVPATALPILSQSGVDTPVDDDVDGLMTEPDSLASTWLRYLATHAAMGGAGMIERWFSRRQKSAENPSVVAYNGTTDITYVHSQLK